MDFKLWLEDQEELIKNLQKDTVLTVFHGTDTQYAYNFCINGIDARKPVRYRIYPHTSGGKPIKFGIFVAPDTKTAFKFGHYVIEFKTKGKDLIYQFPTEMSKANKGYYKDLYPNSFRPAVTDQLLNNPIEPQALFVGLVSPNEIEAVYHLKDNRYDQVVKLTKEEFIAIAEKQKVRSNSSIFNPTEYQMSLSDFVKKIADDQNSSEQEVLEIMVDVYKRSGYLDGIGNVPHSLIIRIEKQLAKYIKNNNL